MRGNRLIIVIAAYFNMKELTFRLVRPFLLRCLFTKYSAFPGAAVLRLSTNIILGYGTAVPCRATKPSVCKPVADGVPAIWAK